jgi:hypoxanthine phosphoribosyltransferase
MKQYNVMWSEIEELCCLISRQDFIKNVSGIYGVKRGGLIPAVILSHYTGLPLSETPENSLVVDDIYDTGHTLQKYIDTNYCATLFNKQKHNNLYSAKQIEDDVWVKFPWETNASSKIDYMKNE